MAVKDENMYIFNKILNILTSSAICDVKHRSLEAVNKVRILVKKEFSKLPLEKIIQHVLNELSSDVKSPCKNKIEFEKQILLLMETYSINLRRMSDILNILKEDLNIDIIDGEIDPEYSKSIRTIHTDIANVIEQGSALNGAKPTLSQFINKMLPPPSELLEERRIHPKPLIIIGEYANTKSFLSTHYNLLREDMVQPLRRSIFQYLTGDTQARKSLYIYDQVRFLHPECDLNQGLMYRVEFSMRGVKEPSRVKWDRCERLKFGTLLCIVKALETDKPCFKEVLWGIVSNRDTQSLQNNLQISLKFSSGFEPRVDFSQNYMMLESREVYFESYCHTLSVLDSMEQLPFTNVLLGKSLACPHPLYLENNTLFDLSPIFPDRNETLFPCLGSWPDVSPVLDESQYRALRLALTKEVSLIQGPPGTGKTFVGAIMLEILLQTKHAYCLELQSQLFDKPVRRMSDAEAEAETPIADPTNFTPEQSSFMSALESPILILTYTNHALDQFLTLLLRFESKIVRIGSKVEQDELLPHCLTELRKKLMPSRYMRNNMESVPYLPGHVLDLKKRRDNLMRNVYEIRDKMTGVGKKCRNEVTLHEVHYINPLQSQSIYDQVQPKEESERLFSYWKEGGDKTYSNNAMEKVREIPPKTKSKRKCEYDSRAEEEMYVHSASDDEDEVDDRLLGNEYEDFEVEQKQIFQWDELPQVLSQYEKAQIVANLPEIPKKILEVENLWSLSKEDRCVLYKHWLGLKQKMLLLMVEEMSDQFSALCAEVEELTRQIDLCILKEAAVIGMTTTGAAKNSQLIRQLKPRIVVVEEAAEVLEAHIIANLTPQVQHLILIGDHQQLRPSNAEFALSKHANIDISLFERLIKNGVEHVTLNYQHRMRPQISSLVRPIYPELLDHDVVMRRENVYGVKENIFFIDHEIPEDHADQENTTKTHRYEAVYLSRLANYLLNRGYGKEEITILTFYQGQKFAILDELRRLDIRLRVSTVDKYQGEENRIVLFSVVRSNKANNIGHCKIDNRVCVALSRAKDGLFMIGNSASLRKASENTKSNLWNKVLDLFETSRISKTFPLICHKHPETYAEINSPDEFEQYNNALCTLPCNEELECGHKCHQLCHYNKKIPCTELCNRTNPDCGHPCVRSDGKKRKLCHERCGKCNYFVSKRLDSCDHEAMLPCHYDPCNYFCEELCERKPDCGHPCVQKDGRTRKLCSEHCGECNYFVKKQLEECNHEKMLHCYMHPVHSLCELRCEKQLRCGHPCTGLCGEDCLKIECRVRVKHELPCTHIVSVLCFEGVNTRSKCQKPCLKMLECGHPCSLKCYEDCKSTDCVKPCIRERMCEHPCTKLCFDDCGPCEFPVQKTIETCGHQVELPCHVEPTHDQCDKLCKMILPCGHACAQYCSENCLEFPCERGVMKYCPCGHKNGMMCWFDSEEYHNCYECAQQCLLPLPCNHICPLKCDADCRTAICQMPCERKYECGHLCFDSVTGQPKPCSKECGQCLWPVVKKLSCGHTKEIPCSQNCEGVKCFEKVKKELACKHVKEMACHAKRSKVKCLEKCTRKLKCGHPCTKKCFEDCSMSKCKAHLSKKLKCGHTSTVTCHEEQGNALPSCTEPCDKTLECGHNCTGDCGDDCSEIVCQIKPRIRLNCSHSIRFMCSEGNKKLFLNPPEIKHVINCEANICEKCTKIKSKVKCEKKCGKGLGCGHECQEACHHPLECIRFMCSEGNKKLFLNPPEIKHVINCEANICEKCTKIKSKVKCEKKCGKDLGCGHECQEACHHPLECLPCREGGYSQCLHSNSRFLCGDIEDRCEQTCEWECKHHTCTKKCWEPCERPVCDEMCSIDQPCGHPCLGLCGEICPEICNTCGKKNDMFHKQVSAPCIKLHCSHIFPVAVLDELFAAVQDSNVAPTCPDCQRPIYNILRYGGSIKKIALKKNEEKRRRIHKTQVHITEECKRIFELNPFSRPLSEFIDIIKRIESEIGNYQLTKLYTIINLLDILAGMVNHFKDVWTSLHYKKLLESRSLNRLITQSLSKSEDSKSLEWIRHLAMKCELCSIFSMINERHESLSSEDAKYLEDNYQEIFVDKLQDDSKCKTYFKELSQLALRYGIDCDKSRCSLTRPRISIPEEINSQAESRIGASGGEKTKLKTEKRHSISQSPSNVATSTVRTKTDSTAIPTQHLQNNLIPRTIKRPVSSTHESEPEPKQPKLSPARTAVGKREKRHPTAVTTGERRTPRNPRRPRVPARQSKRNKPRLN